MTNIKLLTFSWPDSDYDGESLVYSVAIQTQLDDEAISKLLDAVEDAMANNEIDEEDGCTTWDEQIYSVLVGLQDEYPFKIIETRDFYREVPGTNISPDVGL